MKRSGFLSLQLLFAFVLASTLLTSPITLHADGYNGDLVDPITGDQVPNPRGVVPPPQPTPTPTVAGKPTMSGGEAFIRCFTAPLEIFAGVCDAVANP